MHYWAVFSFLLIIVMKYYTVVELRSLQDRVTTLRQDLRRIKQRLHNVQEKQNEVEAERALYEKQFSGMMGTIGDLQIRLFTRDRIEKKPVVSNRVSARYAS